MDYYAILTINIKSYIGGINLSLEYYFINPIGPCGTEKSMVLRGLPSAYNNGLGRRIVLVR